MNDQCVYKISLCSTFILAQYQYYLYVSVLPTICILIPDLITMNYCHISLNLQHTSIIGNYMHLSSVEIVAVFNFINYLVPYVPVIMFCLPFLFVCKFIPTPLHPQWVASPVYRYNPRIQMLYLL